MPLIWYSTWIGIYAEGAEEYDGHDIADEYDEQLYEEAIEPKSLEEGEYEYDGDGIKWDEDEESEDENDTRLNSVKNYQSKQENNTCLLPREMTNQIRMNTGK